jgi:signal transduction histidine kinase
VGLRHTGLDRRLDRRVETAAYRIVQEALTNVARHAGAAEADVAVWADRDVLLVQVEDQGAGFDPGSVPPGRGGLAGMRERAELLGGRLVLDARPGGGTSVSAEFPLRNHGGAPGEE